MHPASATRTTMGIVRTGTPGISRKEESLTSTATTATPASALSSATSSPPPPAPSSSDAATLCCDDAPLSAFQMLEEVSRILKTGGIYMLITYGDPATRVPLLNKAGCKWKIMLYIIPRPGFQPRGGCSSSKSIMEPLPLTDKGLLPADVVLEDPDSNYIYICKKIDESVEGVTVNVGTIAL